MNEPATWQRPITIKRYLHPPKSERIFTLWTEGKVLFGEVNVHGFHVGDNYKVGRSYYFSLESCMAWLLDGEEGNQFDFRNDRHSISEDGVPVHSVTYTKGDVEVTLEGLCNTEKKATCFAKITVRNTGSAPVKDTLTLLLRTAKEADLVYGSPNGYVHHDPDVAVQKALPATWKKENDLFTDGVRVLRLKASDAGWNEETGMIYLPYSLAAGEEATYTFSMDMGEKKDFSYEEEKAAHSAFWLKELARLTKLPKAITEDGERLRMVRCMTAFLLQTFAVTKDFGHNISRQGGLMPITWPSEAISTLEALCRLGDFGDYIEPVLQTHFDTMQEDSGEVMNLGPYWGSVTASVLFAFCKYCCSAKGDFYERYKEKAFKAYAWIRDTRRSVKDTEFLAGGLFPGNNSNDWEHQFQGWTLTDVFNLFALEALAETAEMYDDDRATQVREEHAAYLADMKRHFKKWMDACEGSDELKIPLKPIGDDQHLIDDGFPLIYHGRFILCGVIDKEADIRRVYKYMVSHGISKDGFYGYMIYPNGNKHIWYMSFPEYYWFKIWMKLGEREKAQQILDHQFRFAMTNEYVMLERYADNDPYFVPWSPNASATGRTLMMLLDTLQ